MSVSVPPDERDGVERLRVEERAHALAKVDAMW
jgi:hypothetical protein